MEMATISTIETQVIQALAGTLVLLGLWGIGLLKKWLESHCKFLDAQTDTMITASLERALQNGVSLGAAKLQTALPAQVDAHSLVAKMAIDYANNHAADEIQKLGLTPDQLAEKIEARIAGRFLAAGGTDSAAVGGNPMPAPPPPTAAQVAVAIKPAPRIDLKNPAQSAGA